MDHAKRENILNSAARLFARLGFKKCSIDEIARAAGVAKGTIYLACDSKTDLFYQAVHKELRRWLGEMSQMIDPRTPADELLEQVARAGLAYLDSRPLVRDLLLGLYNGQFPGWADRFDTLRALGQANVAEILELGIKQGLFRADLDTDETATVLQDLHLSGHLFYARAERSNPELLERRLVAGMQLVLNGLRARPDAADGAGSSDSAERDPATQGGR